jgi:uncharacterized membrane protein YccC
MIIFGLAEVSTGLSHTFLGILSTIDSPLSTYAGTGIGVLYASGGLLLLSRRKHAAMLALLCLLAVISGRIIMVGAGLYQVTTPLQVGSIIIGTIIAAVFTTYLWMRRKSFE